MSVKGMGRVTYDLLFIAPFFDSLVGRFRKGANEKPQGKDSAFDTPCLKCRKASDTKNQSSNNGRNDFHVRIPEKLSDGQQASPQDR